MDRDNKAWFNDQEIPVDGFEPETDCRHLVIVLRSDDKHLCTNCEQEFVPVEE